MQYVIIALAFLFFSLVVGALSEAGVIIPLMVIAALIYLIRKSHA